MKTPAIVIISSPQGDGKSTHAQALAEKFGCTRIVDSWEGDETLQPGDLVLTNMGAAGILKHARFE